MKNFLIGLVAFIVVCAMFSSCTNNDNEDYKNTLKSGLGKYYSGETMSKEEYNAVKSFNDWKSKQEPKTYDQWGR